MHRMKILYDRNLDKSVAQRLVLAGVLCAKFDNNSIWLHYNRINITTLEYKNEA